MFIYLIFVVSVSGYIFILNQQPVVIEIFPGTTKIMALGTLMTIIFFTGILPTALFAFIKGIILRRYLKQDRVTVTESEKKCTVQIDDTQVVKEEKTCAKIKTEQKVPEVKSDYDNNEAFHSIPTYEKRPVIREKNEEIDNKNINTDKIQEQIEVENNPMIKDRKKMQSVLFSEDEIEDEETSKKPALKKKHLIKINKNEFLDDELEEKSCNLNEIAYMRKMLMKENTDQHSFEKGEKPVAFIGKKEEKVNIGKSTEEENNSKKAYMMSVQPEAHNKKESDCKVFPIEKTTKEDCICACHKQERLSRENVNNIEYKTIKNETVSTERDSKSYENSYFQERIGTRKRLFKNGMFF